jgi:hypothetical protein
MTFLDVLISIPGMLFMVLFIPTIIGMICVRVGNAGHYQAPQPSQTAPIETDQKPAQNIPKGQNVIDLDVMRALAEIGNHKDLKRFKV